LEEVARHRQIGVNTSIDGAIITTNISMVAAGVKVCDPQAQCPFPKRFLLDKDTPGGLQSRNNCFPLQVMIGKETQETFKEFTDMFNFFDRCESAATNPLEGYQPLDVKVNCDVAATWRGTSKCGSVEVNLMPCHCCSIGYVQLTEPNANPCTRWCQEVHKSDNW
jgi:hypothetical protein